MGLTWRIYIKNKVIKFMHWRCKMKKILSMLGVAFLVGIVIIGAIVMLGGYRITISIPAIPATATTAATATSTNVPSTGTPVVVTPTSAPTLEPTVVALVGYDYDGLPQCDNPDESTPLAGATQNTDGMWEINIHNNGCNLIFEGRIILGERIHRVIVLRSDNGENTEFVKNSVFTYAEGSIWQKPRSKNMEDAANINDPAEALKLLNDKRAVMDTSGYDWPIWLYFTDGNTTEFGPGETWEGLTAQNHCDISEPVQINVHGEKLTGKNQFSAAIGATNCVTVAWIDGSKTPEQWTDQRDAVNKVTFVTINAWLMPVAWSQDQIDAWITTHQ